MFRVVRWLSTKKVTFAGDININTRPVIESFLGGPLTQITDKDLAVKEIKGDNIETNAKQDLVDADVLVLLTDQRHLDGKLNELVRQVIDDGKPNIVIGLQVPETDSIAAQQTALTQLSQKFTHLPQAPKVVTVRHEGSKLVSSAYLESEITKILENPQLQELTQQFKHALAEKEALKQQKQQLEMLQDFDNEFKKFETQVVQIKQRLEQDFQTNDLSVLKTGVIDITKSLNDYFARFPFYKLFWRGDYIADDVKSILHDHPLVQAEYQMAFATGKLSASITHVYEQLDQFLDGVVESNRTQGLGKLSSEMKHLRESLIAFRQQPSAILDPFMLRNQIAVFDESKQADVLQKQSRSLIPFQVGFQTASYLTGLLLTHFGLPWTISVPATILVSSLGFWFMSIKWQSAQRRFLANLSQSQKGLQERLQVFGLTRASS
ncbi:hypothetical protein EDD86DRAFT_206803 [Gorgonomyces haynaldii]|nr:hypothetical protein EDD86DRAFT_206803 [Gorgonomyces haynaldii]